MNFSILIALELLSFFSYIQLQVNNYEHTGNGPCLKFDADGNCTCCDSGYRGQTCDLKCEYCSTRLIVGELCSYSCTTGYYGDTCQKICPRTCADGSNGKPFCTETNGKLECGNGCIPGFAGQQCLTCNNSHRYGDYCNITCSKGCLSGICNKTGHCTEGCMAGFYDENCSSQCGNNCIRGRCTHDIHSTYTCTQGCKDGFTGRNCSEMCPDYCKICNQRTGRCTACVNNYVQTSKPGECIKEGRLGNFILILVGVTIVGVTVAVVIFVVWKKCFSKDKSRGDAEIPLNKIPDIEGDISSNSDSSPSTSDYSDGPTDCLTSNGQNRPTNETD